MEIRNKINYYNGDYVVELEAFQYDRWTTGMDEMFSKAGMISWKENQIRLFVSAVLSQIIGAWNNIIISSGLNRMLHVAMIVFTVLFMFIDTIDRFQDKERTLAFPFAFMILLCEMVLILLFMPTSTPQYLYPFLYGGYLLLFLRIYDRHQINAFK